MNCQYIKLYLLALFCTSDLILLCENQLPFDVNESKNPIMIFCVTKQSSEYIWLMDIPASITLFISKDYLLTSVISYAGRIYLLQKGRGLGGQVQKMNL